MPLLAKSSFRARPFLGNGHVQTVLPLFVRTAPSVAFERERIETADGDVLDIDWARSGRDRLAILTHGLEGNSRTIGQRRMIEVLHRAGWDVAAWNYRGCGGVPNRLARWTHAGASHDLATVVEHARELGRWHQFAVVGYSLGGNITLKYAAELGANGPGTIAAAVGISVPCDLEGSARHLMRRANAVYQEYYLRRLRKRALSLRGRAPDWLDGHLNGPLRSFAEFDGKITAPLHGFGSAEEYWRESSCGPVLGSIAVPTLLVNAQNDPILSKSCFPIAAAEASSHLTLEIPQSGGHCGFLGSSRDWLEKRTAQFLCEAVA